jgi:hypothetical protein
MPSMARPRASYRTTRADDEPTSIAKIKGGVTVAALVGVAAIMDLYPSLGVLDGVPAKALAHRGKYLGTE